MKYRAFISYRHSANSRQHAEALERALKRYAKPLLRPPMSIFRDERILRPGHDLPGEIRRGLERSEYLIYLATAEAARSEWVQEELHIWCAVLGRSDRLLIIHLDDNIVATPTNGIDWDKSDALPQVLRPVTNGTPVWHDLTWASTPEQSDLLNADYRKVINAIVARFREVDPGAMNDTEVLTHRRNIRLRNAAMTSIAVLAFLALLFGYFSNRFAKEAQREAWRVERNQMQILSALSETELREGQPVDAVKLAIAAWPKTEGREVHNASSDGLLESAISKLSRLWSNTSTQPPQVQSSFAALSNALPNLSQSASVDAHEGGARAVIFTRNGERILSAGADGKIGIWDARTAARLLEPIEGHNGIINSIALSKNGSLVATGGQDGMIRIWDISTMTDIVPPISAEIGGVLSLAFSPEGDVLVAGGSKAKVRMWNVESGENVPIPELPHQGFVVDVEFFPDGSLVASSDNFGGVHIWDRKSGSPIGQPLMVAPRQADYFEISPNGTQILTAGNDASLRSWDVETRERDRFLHTEDSKHDGPILAMDISPSSSVFATGGLDGKIKTWSTTSGGSIASPFLGHSGPVFSVGFSPDGKQLVSGGADGTVRVWRIGPREDFELRRLPVLFANSRVTSPDGQRYVGKNINGLIGIWDSETGTMGVPITVDDRFVNEFSFSQDSSRIVIDRWKFRIVDADTGRVVGKPMLGGPKHHCFIFNPTGDRVVSCASEANLAMWDVETGEKVWQADVPAESGSVLVAAFSTDGKTVVSGSSDGWIRFWRAEDGEEAMEPQAAHRSTQFGSINSIDFSADGSFFITGGVDGTIRFWDPLRGVSIGEIPSAHGQNGDAYIKISSDGEFVGSMGNDRVFKLWDVDTFIQVGSFGPVSEYDRIHSFSVSEDERARIVLRSHIVAWDISELYGNPFSIACERLPYLEGKKDLSVGAKVLNVEIEIPDLLDCDRYDPPEPWWTVPSGAPPQPPQ